MAAVADILDFWSKWFYLFLIYKSLKYFLLSFESKGLSIQEKKFEIDAFKMVAMVAILDFRSELF